MTNQTISDVPDTLPRLCDGAIEPVDGATEPITQCRVTRRAIIINTFVVVIPFVGLAAAMLLSWGVAFDWKFLVLMAAMAIVSEMGVTIGYHRLCTHKSFTTPAWLRYVFAAMGSMAAQGAVVSWCAEHRRHHQHSDTQEDPHSPHMAAHGTWGDGVWATIRGAWHAHVGWLFTSRKDSLEKYSRDLVADRAVVAADRHFVFWVIAGLVFPAVLGGLFMQSWWGVLLGFLWGGLVRVLLVHHITWSVNSICHLWGGRPFDSRDESRNNFLVGVMALGEGWHNNHHAFPTSARHGLSWWQIDVSYLVIVLLRMVGLARNVRVPDAGRIEAKRSEAARRRGRKGRVEPAGRAAGPGRGEPIGQDG